MSCMQHLGLSGPRLAERVESSGRWAQWVSAEPVLACARGLEEMADFAGDRTRPGRADELLAALVRLGAVDGGNDQDAAHAVALLLTAGAERLASQLRNLSADIDQMVVGQVWLQIRAFPWRRRRHAIAKNILMDSRKALLRDLGVNTSRCNRGVVLLLTGTGQETVLANGSPTMARRLRARPTSGDEHNLEEVLDWATGNGVLTPAEAAILSELANVRVAGAVRGLNSAAEINVVASAHGVNERTVRRSRDKAVRSLVSARAAYLRECA